MNKATIVLVCLALASITGRTDATEIIIVSKNHPSCSDTNNLIFVEHPFNRTKLYQGEHVKMTERRLRQIVKEPLTESKWGFAATNSVALSAFYAATGEINKLKAMTPIIDHLYSVQTVRDILLSNPNTYMYFLSRHEGPALHRWHLWLALGEIAHLEKSLAITRDQLKVWNELETDPQYDAFEDFLKSIVPLPPAPLRKGQKLPDQRLGAGTRSGVAPRLQYFDRVRAVQRGTSSALRFAPAILVDAALYLKEAELSESEQALVARYFSILSYDREQTDDGIFHASDHVMQWSEMSHGGWIDKYTGVVLPNIAARLKSEHQFFKASVVLGEDYDLSQTLQYYYRAEKRDKNCHSVETQLNIQLHKDLWHIVAVELGHIPQSQCSNIVARAKKTLWSLRRKAGRKKWTVFGGTSRLRHFQNLHTLKMASKRLSRSCSP